MLDFSQLPPKKPLKLKVVKYDKSSLSRSQSEISNFQYPNNEEEEENIEDSKNSNNKIESAPITK